MSETDPKSPELVWEKIESRADFQRFVEMDLEPRGLTRLPWLYQIRFPIIHYMMLLRRCEYHAATARSKPGKLWFKWLNFRRRHLGAKLGFTIGLNTLGPGAYILHWGRVVISGKARIGKFARINPGVSITRNPRIGDNVYFGPGCFVSGDITVESDAQIGANSVVTKDVRKGAVVMGNPARVVG